MTRLSNIELFSISASVAISALILSFTYCQITEKEWTLTHILIASIPVYICSIIYMTKRHREINHLEELEQIYETK